MYVQPVYAVRQLVRLELPDPAVRDRLLRRPGRHRRHRCSRRSPTSSASTRTTAGRAARRQRAARRRSRRTGHASTSRSPTLLQQAQDAFDAADAAYRRRRPGARPPGRPRTRRGSSRTPSLSPTSGDRAPRTAEDGGARPTTSRRRRAASRIAPIDLGRPRPIRNVVFTDAGWSSSVARWAHNPEVAGSNPAPATKSGSESTDSGPDGFTRCVRLLRRHLGGRSSTASTRRCWSGDSPSRA